MKASDIPNKFSIPFANNAGGSYIWDIPASSQIGITDGRASLYDGFVPLNFIPIGAGGVPPFGKDFNGLMKQTTAWSRWQGAGGAVKFDSVFAGLIGGYPQGAIVSSTTFGGFWLSTADDNAGDPDAGAPNWLAFYPYVKKALTANADYYVATTGSDSNVGDAAHPWLTMQHAWDFCQNGLNLNGFKVTVHVAAGTYAAAVTGNGQLTGASSPDSFTIIGDTATPSNVVTSSPFVATNNASIYVRGMRCTSTSPQGGTFQAANGGSLMFDSIEFGIATNVHLYATSGGRVLINGGYTVFGGAGVHFYSNVQGLIGLATSTPFLITVTGTPAFSSAFADSRISSLINLPASIVSFTGAATGVRYLADYLSNIYTEGGGANFFPGNSAGATSTGSQYN